jgi:hypothetical protein
MSTTPQSAGQLLAVSPVWQAPFPHVVHDAVSN